jgi:site-specific recombinase
MVVVVTALLIGLVLVCISFFLGFWYGAFTAHREWINGEHRQVKP